MKAFTQHRKVSFCLICSDNNNNNWIQGLITYINLNKKIVEVFLSDEHLLNTFSREEKVTIKSFNSNNEFLFSGHIKKITSSIQKKAIIIGIDDIKKFVNNRKHERYYVSTDVSIGISDDQKSNANLIDISLGGVYLNTESSFAEGDLVKTEVLYDPETPICFTGKILRKFQHKDNFKYGIMVVDIDKTNGSLLTELIYFLDTKKIHIEREWKMFKRIKYAIYTVSVFAIFFTVFVILASQGM